MPPNIPLFDAANKPPFLHPVRKAQAQKVALQPPLSSNPGPDINLLTSVLLQMIANFSQPTGTCGLTSQVANPTSPIPVPTTPVHHVSETAASPPIPFPSQLM